jgi:mannose-6-phosphate isomerase-like protein (cupin superfamily)
MADDNYTVELDNRYGHLELIDIAAEAAAHSPSVNVGLTDVNGTGVRLSVFQGEFHWHKHDDTDEFFLVLEGQLQIDIASQDTVTLAPQQGFVVPRGTVHRTRADRRTTSVVVEAATVSPTGD